MNYDVKKAILNKIKEYDRIVISRHIRPDGDAVGSTEGLRHIIKLSFPEKDIRVVNSDFSDYLSFLEPVNDSADTDFYSNALVIVIDTATTERISNRDYALGAELIKIDHHIDNIPYGDISWVEPFRSSSCEMIADFWLTFRDELTLDCEGATFLYTGMVTDSGRFRFSSTSPDTLRCAAALLDLGVDTQTLFAHLYLEDFSYLKFKSYIYEKLLMTENGVLYLYVDKKMQEQFGLTAEAASNTVSFMDSVKDSLIWLAFIDNPDGTIRVRLRSRFVTVNELAGKYGGGGHEYASGATVHSESEMKALIDDADALIKEYKTTHRGWL